MVDADPAVFRRRATRLYRTSLAALAALAAISLALAWIAHGRWGLAAGLVVAAIGLVLSAGGAVAATLVWAMSQDGA